MTAHPDLASLARELLERLSAPLYRERSNCQVSCRTVRDLCTAVLRESAAESDEPCPVCESTPCTGEGPGCWKPATDCDEDFIRGLTECPEDIGRELRPMLSELRALRAQLAAAKRDYLETTEGMRREQAELCSQLAAAAPLFEAAHRHNNDEDIDEPWWDAIGKWARSEAGQRWKRGQGR